MTWQRWTVALASVLLTAASGWSADRPAPDFTRQVAPLLAARCLECHSGAKPKGGLDLTRQETLRKGGESGRAVVAGKPSQSVLWERVRDDEMPPKHPLRPAEKAVLKQWIAGGAAWGSPKVIDRFRYTTAERAGYDWWSLQPLRSPTPPPVRKAGWVRTPVDRFILKRLEQAGLQPSPEAEPRALLRRLYFDLIGLPPPPEVIEQFARDPSDAAYRRIVDRLLKQPEYGERWGRHWLDVARFGESNGFERNGPRKNFWHYRDWVIRALNDDMPYDRFVRMQLAGDLLDDGYDGAAAVGFLVAGVHNTVVGGSKRMKLLARQDELEEIIAAVGQSFLGLTVNCARCHDHKFDPIRNREYYSMIAAIDGVAHGERKVAKGDAAKKLAVAEKRLAGLTAALGAFDQKARKRVLAQRAKQQADKRRKAPTDDRPEPIATWEFEGNLKDSRGKLHGTAHGGARVENGALIVDGKSAYVSTARLDFDLAEKTLEAWVLLDNLDQRGGGVISLQTPNGQTFDAIVFGEREPRRWMAGSNGFVRTRSFNGPEEKTAAAQPVHVAITYRRDGSITGYRNGKPYGRPYKTGFQPFRKGNSQVLFGLRHAAVGGNRMLRGKILRANLYDSALDPSAIAASAGVESDYVSEKTLVAALSAAEQTKRRQLKEQVREATAIRDHLAGQARAAVYTVAARKPGVMRIHVRGSVTQYGPAVEPGGVSAVPGPASQFGVGQDAPDRPRRLKLAEWITDANNPLFARVIVNRVWHYHFGVGLVDTPNDLGFNGGRPSHPDLIDYLASDLKRHGFRLKRLHRLLVTSAAYRQSSANNRAARQKDAGNRLLWRYSPRRIEAEALRDALLVVSGALNPRRGGPGFEDVSITPNNGTTYYEPVDKDDPQLYRRTVYRFTPRGGRSAVLDTFDCPDPSAAAPRRSVTTTPLQALSLLNNAFVLRMSERFAARAQKEAAEAKGSPVVRAWQLALGRAPDAEELRLSQQLVAKRGLAALCRGLFNSNEFVVIE